MDDIGQSVPLDQAVEVLGAQLAGLRALVEPLQRELDRQRTCGLLWRAVAHIKMTELAETRQQFSNTSNQLEHKVEMNQQLLRLLQESVKFADELKATSKESREKLEREKEELSLQACQIGENNDSLKSKVERLEEDNASQKRTVDEIEAVKEEWDRERAKMTAQVKLSEEKADTYRGENEHLKMRANILDRQIHVLEEQLKAAKEDAGIMSGRVAQAEQTKRLLNRPSPLGLFTGEIMEDGLETRVRNGDNM